MIIDAVKIFASAAGDALKGQVSGGGGEVKNLEDQVLDMPTNDASLQETVKNVLNAVYLSIGILAVIFIIVGGISYSVSQGDVNKVKKAKDTIMYGVIGLVVALLAFAITQFVLNAL